MHGVCEACLVASSVTALHAAATMTGAGEATAVDNPGGVPAGCHGIAISV